jgi:hypothetical protein
VLGADHNRRSLVSEPAIMTKFQKTSERTHRDLSNLSEQRAQIYAL